MRVAVVLILTLLGSVAPKDGLAETISCSLLRAQIYDGIPGPGVLVGPSTGGCPSQAAASSADIDATASAKVTFSGNGLDHLHELDLIGSATTRVAISEAFLSFQAPVHSPTLVLAPSFSIEGSTYSTILQLEALGESLTYFTGVPVLAGESTVQADSAGPIPAGSITLIPGASYTLYSRLSTFGDFDQSNAATFTFTLIPEPSTALLLAAGLAGVAALRRSRRPWGSKTLWMVAFPFCLLLPASSEATPIIEAFDTDTADVTDGSYPDFALNVGTASVSGGVLQLGGGTFVQRFTRGGFSGDLIISGQIQAASFGDWNVGMEFGNRRFIFHPGFSGGAFRIEDASLGSLGILVGSLDMGFTPSTTAFHRMELEWDLSLNQLTVTVEDGDGIADPFVVLWTPDSGFDATGRIGFTYHDGGGAGPGLGFFDNLTIVPEPATALLLGSGLIVLAVGKRGRGREAGHRARR